mgnify:CR=1 FL=1
MKQLLTYILLFCVLVVAQAVAAHLKHYDLSLVLTVLAALFLFPIAHELDRRGR